MKRPAVLLALAALALAGCGETVIDSAKTEDALTHNLEDEVGQKIASVDCPSDVEVEKGRVFTCTITRKDGLEATASLKILNEDADVKLIDLRADK